MQKTQPKPNNGWETKPASRDASVRREAWAESRQQIITPEAIQTEFHVGVVNG